MDSKTATIRVQEKNSSGPRHFCKFDIFYALIFTSTLTGLLVAANGMNWHLTGEYYQLVTNNRASVQIAVQILANLLGLIHVTAICRLINYATRIYFSEVAISLSSLRAWIALSVARLDLDLPIAWLLPLAVFIAFTLIPSALWAGAITPVMITTVIESSLMIPSYENVSLIREYPAQPDSSNTSPFVRNINGLFTYKVGAQFTGMLLSNAAGATTFNGDQFQHAKFDNTKYTYNGRSYGVGAAVGLGDGIITSNTLATQYSYQEVGYSAQVTCIYNMSNALTMAPFETYLYTVTGYLPDSPPGVQEYNTYVGTDDKEIVAISISSSDLSPRRYLAIVAGSSYNFLNSTQCAIDYTPMLFNVSVGIIARTISVIPAGEIADFNPERNLTRTTTQQFGQISVVETNMYISEVGNALNSSVAGWRISHPDTSYDNATLAGLEAAFLVMTDDILAAYGSAQLVVGNFSKNTPALVHVNAVRFGSAIYIIAIFILNTIIVLAFAAEAIRTGGWKNLIYFDYLDSTSLIVSSSIGGPGIADAILHAEKSTDHGIGRMLVKLQNRNGMVAIQYAGTSGTTMGVDRSVR
jgi:hypothetical protein